MNQFPPLFTTFYQSSHHFPPLCLGLAPLFTTLNQFPQFFTVFFSRDHCSMIRMAQLFTLKVNHSGVELVPWMRQRDCGVCHCVAGANDVLPSRSKTVPPVLMRRRQLLQLSLCQERLWLNSDIGRLVTEVWRSRFFHYIFWCSYFSH